MVTRRNRVNPLEKRCEDLKLLRCLIRPSLRHEKQRSFLFSRADLLNRTDPVEAVRKRFYRGLKQKSGCYKEADDLLLLSRMTRNADYIMYSTFLTASSGSVLFSRSNLLKRKDLCFSCLRLDLISHRRSLRSSHLFLSGLTRFCRVTTRENFTAQVQDDTGAPHMSALPDSSQTVVTYLGYLFESGTISAKSLQPYLSVINVVHNDFEYPPLACGHLVKLTHKGFAELQGSSMLQPKQVMVFTEEHMFTTVMYDLRPTASRHHIRVYVCLTICRLHHVFSVTHYGT